MAGKSPIEWTEQTWNPIVGCSIVSPGCTNCYAMKMAARIEAMAGDGLDDDGYAVRGTHPLDHYRTTTKRSNSGPVWTGKVALAPESALLAPLRRRKPTTYFVNSMGDLFHESVPDEWIDRVFAVMALSPQHTFQVLTKRSARMRAYMEKRARNWILPLSKAINLSDATIAAADREGRETPHWPLPNVWLGVSAEDQRRYDEREADLKATPAAVRFLSIEPMLGPIDMRFPRVHHHPDNKPSLALDALVRAATEKMGGWLPDWIIVGGESGPGARPMHPDWPRSIRDQCAAASVPFFFKQWGAWEPVSETRADAGDWGRDWMLLDRGGDLDIPDERIPIETFGEVAVANVGKKRAGRLLDGVLHDAMPARVSA